MSLDPTLAADWPFLDDSPAAPIDGLAELHFESPDHERQFFASMSERGRVDGQVFLRRVDTLRVGPGGVTSPGGSAELGPAEVRAVLLARDADARGDLGDRWASVARRLWAGPDTVFIRSTVIDAWVPGIADLWVDRASGAGQRPEVVLEVGFESRAALRRAFQAPEVAALVRRLHDDFHVSARRVLESSTYVAGGRVTQVGRRGPRAAGLITAFGAVHLVDY